MARVKKTEDMKKYMQEYNKNRDPVLKKQKANEYITCECGGKHTKSGKCSHIKTRKHENGMLKKEIEKLKNSNRNHNESESITIKIVEASKYVSCECGSTYLRYYRDSHLRSKNHQIALLKIELEKTQKALNEQLSITK
jgi:hypothetical protein